MEKKREGFGSRTAVIFAMAGSAIGLGNLWRFPYMVGEHGGAVFVLIYIVATILFSLPIFIAEVIIGRRSHTNARDAFVRLAPGKPFWRSISVLPILIPTIIASYYSVIGGWSLDYFFKACSLEFLHADPGTTSGIFTGFVSSTWVPVLMHLLFLAMSAIVVALGVKAGIEKFSKFILPVLFFLIVAIALYSMSLPGAGEGVRYLFKPDFSEFTPRTFAYALGQSFYSLSLGMGIIITYGSYVHRNENILVSSAGTAVSDLLFALLAGLAIMPAVFAAGIEPGAGPGLIFQSIPYIFCKMGQEAPALSTVVAGLFFFTVIVAAMTSLISLIEVGTAFLVEKFRMRRGRAVFVMFLVCGAAGTLCSLSFGPLSGLKVSGMNIFDIFDWVASNILLLIMAFLSVVFVGFVMKKEDVRDEFTNGGTKRRNVPLFNAVYFLIKWVAPIAVLLIFFTNFTL
ncbi:MAG: sodium-dependent transporter [Bacteroidales bacterium]|nr:sodium-dependent transporter [Bacteroidales bacterium]